jgi:hypothetical protein
MPYLFAIFFIGTSGDDASTELADNDTQHQAVQQEQGNNKLYFILFV